MNHSYDEQRSLVDRLREYITDDESTFEISHPICDEAAAEIERLIGEIEELKRHSVKTGDQIASATRAALVRTDRESRKRFNEQAVRGGCFLTADEASTLIRTGAIDLSAKPQVVVSSEMVDVGVRVLRESGFLSGKSSADHLLVREMLEKVLALQSGN